MRSAADNARLLQIINFDAQPTDTKYMTPSSTIVAAEAVRSFAWQPNAGFDDSEDVLVVSSNSDRAFLVWRTAASSTSTKQASVCEGVAIPACSSRNCGGDRPS